MCGRFALYSESIADHFKLVRDLPQPPRYNIAPTQQILIITHARGFPNRSSGLSRWGLIPHWAKDEKIGSRLINARAETLTEKPSFKEAYQQRRCLIPASGFFEWNRKDARREPFFIEPKDRGLFGFAGLWEKWRSPSGETVVSSAIITTEANGLIQKIHDRMPAIIQPDQYDLWLSPAANRTTLQQLLKPYSPYKLSVHRVSTLVNSTQNDTHDCIKPIAP